MKKIKFPSWICLVLSIAFASNVAAASDTEIFTPEQEAKLATFLNKDFYIYETHLVGTPAQFKEFLTQHLAYQVKLEKEGTMFAAGPLFVEGHKGTPELGMIIIRANSWEEAKAIADADPFHASGVREYTMRKWVMNEGSLDLTIKFSDQSVEVK